MAGGGSLTTGPVPGLALVLPITSIAPASVVARPAELDPVVFPTIADVGGIMPVAYATAAAGGGTMIRGLMPGLPLSTAVTGSAPSTNAAAAFTSVGSVELAGLPGMIGLQALDNDNVPNVGATPAGVEGMIPLAASNAAVEAPRAGEVAMPAAGQAVIAPSAPICPGAERLPILS